MIARTDLTDTDRYLVQAAAERLAKWIAKETTWRRRCAQYRLDPTFDLNVRTMPSKNSKGHAYDDGGTIAMFLGEARPNTVADLGRLVGLAFTV